MNEHLTKVCISTYPNKARQRVGSRAGFLWPRAGGSALGMALAHSSRGQIHVEPCKACKVYIVKDIFRLWWPHSGHSLALIRPCSYREIFSNSFFPVDLEPNGRQSENDNYNLISGWFSKISRKNSLCIEQLTLLAFVLVYQDQCSGFDWKSFPKNEWASS